MELKTLFDGIAAAIRERDGTAEKIAAKSFPERIRELPSGSNPNILINADFRKPVNRNGKDVYESSKGEILIDGWKHAGTGITLGVEDGHITLSPLSAPIGYPNIRQFVSDYGQFSGREITVSAIYRTNSNDVQIAVLAAATSQASVFIDFPKSDDWALSQKTGVIPADPTRFMVALQFKNTAALDDYFDVKAIKIEFGARQTLAHQNESGEWVVNDPIDFEGEYAKCAQYSPAAWEWTGYHQITLSPTEGGSVSGGGIISGGMVATVKAEAKAGYQFSGWLEGDTVVSADAAYTFAVSGDRTLTARFEAA